MIAVICGSTGLVGSLLVTKLLSDDSITKVISVTRRSLNLSHQKLHQVLISDLADLPKHKNELKGDIYFCCLGTTIKDAGSQENFRKVDFEAIVNFGKIAEAHHAQSLTVISAMMANSNSKIFYNRVKGETEAELFSLKINRLVIFRPALLIGKRKVLRPAERLSISLMNAISKIIPDTIAKSLGTKVETLAEHMLKSGKNTSKLVAIINAKDI